MSDRDLYDIAIIGGGINGAGIARDAAGRGHKVLLCEKGDLAGATSSASTKLIHGGLRYLEYYEFRLVREALREREVLLQAAPHIIWPLQFVLPHSKALRPAWLIRLGLFLYDHLARRSRLPGSKMIDLREHAAGAPLKPDYRKAFVYSDCWVQDARLVVLNALDAAERGAEILLRTECLAARRAGDSWHLRLRSRTEGPGPDAGEREIRARALVNATGPWVGEVKKQCIGIAGGPRVRLVKGSHIVVPQLFGHPDPYIFQNSDKRIVFAIPYEDGFTLIGTTDVEFAGDPGQVAISEDEVRYLCDAVNRYFERAVRPEDVVWSYAGVRPLHDEDDPAPASAVSRDYRLELQAEGGAAPLLSVYGGKITTYRMLAEHALEKLDPVLGGRGGPWTAGACLPGGDFPDADFDGALARFCADHPWLPQDLARRYLRNYGTRAETMLAGAGALAQLGEHFGDGLYEAELNYLATAEWARSAEDALWRRSKLGLHLDEAARARVAAWFAARQRGAASGGGASESAA